MRILLVNAPGNNPGAVANKLGRWIPGEQLGLCYLAAVLRRDGHAVEILDAFLLGLTIERTVAVIKSRIEVSGLVGLSASDGKQFGAAGCLKQLADLAPGIHLTLGGHTATLCAAEFLDEFPRLDSVIRGEGEIPLASLCRQLSAGADWRGTAGLAHRDADGAVVMNGMAPIVEDLDSLPFPARDNLAFCVERDFSISIETSRGCKGVCTFCATRMMYRPSVGPLWRARSVESIIGEIEYLKETYGVARFSIEDEDFLGWGVKEGFGRAREFADSLIRRGLNVEFSILTRVDNVDRDLLAHLKKAGLTFVFIGVESGSQKSLDFFVKETSIDQNAAAIRVLKDLDIEHEILWIMYDPSSTLEDVRANLDFLNNIDVLNINLVNDLRVYHGTPMHKRLAREGRLTGDFLEYRYEFADPRVARFKEVADVGLSAFYQVLRHIDVMRWKVQPNSSFADALTLVERRLHLSASKWLEGLLVTVNADEEADRFGEEAVTSASQSAILLERLVSRWPTDATQ